MLGRQAGGINSSQRRSWAIIAAETVPYAGIIVALFEARPRRD
jgi:hypothetical protein